MGTLQVSAVRVCALCYLLAGLRLLLAAPFQVNAAADIRADYTISWSEFSTVHGTVVPDATDFTASDGGTDTTIFANSTDEMTIWSNGGLFTSGVLLANPGPEVLLIYPLRKVQGFGLTIEHLQSVPATYEMEFYTITSEFIGKVTAESPGNAGNPVFLGMIDPEARIEIIIVRALPGNIFALSDPVFQLPQESDIPIPLLPIATTLEMNVDGAASYLHEGRGGREKRTKITTNASEENENVCELSTDFPGIRGGDYIHFERIGSSKTNSRYNNLLAVFSSNETILDGKKLKRVPGALQAGIGYRTRKVSGGAISTPTNIPEDFVVGNSSYVKVPSGANYLFFSLDVPSEEASDAQVRLNHIPATLFLDWVNSFGLVGANADLESDLDRDGLTLLEEFAFRKNPTVADRYQVAENSYLPVGDQEVGENENQFALRFGGRLFGPLTYRAEFSSDLQNWDEVGPESIELLNFDGEGGTFRFLDRQEDQVKRFGRILIDLQEIQTN